MTARSRILFATMLVASLAILGGTPTPAADAPAAPSPNDWLLNAPNDTERFRLLQGQLRGTDQPMWEIGERYLIIYDALARENFDLAVYHWDKIKAATENALQKRPARRANAEALFLKSVWQDVRDGYASRDRAKAWNAFEKGTAACRACHTAEKLEYMNDQPMFELKTGVRHRKMRRG